MNRINNTDGGAAGRARFANGLVSKEGKWLLSSGRGVQRKINRRVKLLAGWVATCALLFSPCSTEERSVIGPLTAFIARIESRSIVSMRWRGWKNCTRTADF